MGTSVTRLGDLLDFGRLLHTAGRRRKRFRRCRIRIHYGPAHSILFAEFCGPCNRTALFICTEQCGHRGKSGEIQWIWTFCRPSIWRNLVIQIIPIQLSQYYCCSEYWTSLCFSVPRADPKMLRNCPHAAKISRPRLMRTVVVKFRSKR